MRKAATIDAAVVDDAPPPMPPEAGEVWTEIEEPRFGPRRSYRVLGVTLGDFLPGLYGGWLVVVEPLDRLGCVDVWTENSFHSKVRFDRREGRLPADQRLTTGELLAAVDIIEAATDGPWEIRWESCGCGDSGYGCSHPDYPYELVAPSVSQVGLDGRASPKVLLDGDGTSLDAADARFVVLARHVLPRVLAELAQFRAAAGDYGAVIAELERLAAISAEAGTSGRAPDSHFGRVKISEEEAADWSGWADRWRSAAVALRALSRSPDSEAVRAEVADA